MDAAGDEPQFELVDLSGVHLAGLQAIPGSVLDHSLRRLVAEAEHGDEVYSAFESSL